MWTYFFNLTVTAKSSVPEQLERPPFWKPCWRLGRLAWGHYATRNTLISRKTTSAPKWSNVLWLGVQTKSQRFQKIDKLSSTALKNKPLFNEWLVCIEKVNLLKLDQYQICLEHFEKFRALDTKPRKLSLGLLFVNKSVEREGAMLYI